METQLKKSIVIVAFLFFLSGIAGALQPGVPVDLRLDDLSGNKVSLVDFRGKIVFLNFWTTWCSACRVEMPAMQQLYTRFKDQDFAMVTVNLQESPRTIRAFVERHDLTFTVLQDPQKEAGTRFGIRALPTTFILDKAGRIMGQAIGAREWYSRKMIDLFSRLVEEG